VREVFGQAALRRDENMKPNAVAACSAALKKQRQEKQTNKQTEWSFI
jgi:hypothetical protein